MSTPALLERIERRRFVGRELMLWLWFESEIFEGTLETTAHGEIGLWIERSIVLSAGREATRIRGAQPAAAREPKESLLRGKWPDAVGWHLSWGGRDLDFTWKAETLAVAGLSGPRALEADDPEPLALEPARRPRKKPRDEERRRAEAEDEERLTAADRMQHAAEVEAVLEGLYRDFLRLRLSPAWERSVLPAINAWIRGESVDADAYARARRRALR